MAWPLVTYAISSNLGKDRTSSEQSLVSFKHKHVGASVNYTGTTKTINYTTYRFISPSKNWD